MYRNVDRMMQTGPPQALVRRSGAVRAETSDSPNSFLTCINNAPALCALVARRLQVAGPTEDAKEQVMTDPHSLHVHDDAAPASVPVLIDRGLRAYMLGVYNFMAGGLALTGLVAYVGVATGFYASIAGTPIFWIVLFAPLAIVLFLGFRIQSMSLTTARFSFWLYAALVGLSLSGVFIVYTGESIARVFFISAATFAAMSLFGYTTRADLSRFGSFLVMGLVGIVIAGLVNLFLASSALQFAISVIGVIIFIGLTAYDTQRIKAIYVEGDDEATAGKKAIMGALALYLDFLNLFLLLLQLLGDRRR